MTCVAEYCDNCYSQLYLIKCYMMNKYVKWKQKKFVLIKHNINLLILFSFQIVLWINGQGKQQMKLLKAGAQKQ